MKKNIIYLGSDVGYESAYLVLRKFANVHKVLPDKKKLIDNIKNADAILDASMKVQIDDNVIKYAKKLKIISCATTGSNHISKNLLKNKSIKLFTLKEDKSLIKNITPAAELSWLLLMSCARNLISASNDVKKGNWNRELFPGIMLQNKTIGIIGCGRIGQWVSNYANAFKMKVVGYDPYLNKFPNNIKKVSLNKLFEISNFISIHVHLTDETKLLVSSKLINKSKKGVIIINTSRGQIIDEDALINALKTGHVKSVGLDVLSDEPYINKSKLFKYSKHNENVIITPHCGGNSPDAVKIVCKRAAEKILKFL